MKDDGWQGRPLLVIECEEDYQAWTGSQRLAAAELAGLEAVPCHVVAKADILAVGGDATFGHVDDSERFAIIQKLDDEDAISLMWQEGRV